MFVPDEFGPESDEAVRLVLRQVPIGTLVTTGLDGTPVASAVPTIEQQEDAVGPLAGSVLLCHMNRSNPHWGEITSGTPALLVHHLAGHYVTPSTYPPGPAAPTWDFVHVQVRGRLEPLVEAEDVFGLLRATASRLEARFGERWDDESSLDYYRRIQRGVGAMHFFVDDVQAMFKLSQDKPPQQRAALESWLRSRATADAAAVADRLAALPDAVDVPR
jgi:transcriptional regulator